MCFAICQEYYGGSFLKFLSGKKKKKKLCLSIMIYYHEKYLSLKLYN